jgi:hypothetical protein
MKKAIGGEANNLQAALDMLSNPVPNIIKTPEEKNKKKSSAAALIELEVDPVFRVPTNVKTFVDSVLLNKKDNITNKNFSNSELKVVKDLIVESANNKNVYTESLENPFNPLNYIPEGKKTSAKRAKMLDDMKGGDLTTPGYVDYNTYNKKTGLGSINSSPGFHSVFSDTGKVLTTLGQFNYSILPNGDVQVTDTYDFNPMLLDDQGQESKRANAFTNSELSVLSGGYYPLRKLGEKLLPEREGKGRKINIVLPKDLFSKEEYSSIKNLTNSRIKKATGGEANNLQAAIDLLNNPVTSSISPLGDPTLSPLMESLQKNPIDDFAMMMADPTKVGLKVINTPIKMQLKKLFAKRNKIRQLIDKQKFNYDRGLDLASKADPRDIAQGNFQVHVALKSGKRFQKQLNTIEEDIRKLYKNK